MSPKMPFSLLPKEGQQKGRQMWRKIFFNFKFCCFATFLSLLLFSLTLMVCKSNETGGRLPLAEIALGRKCSPSYF
jgi:hypothetical protein